MKASTAPIVFAGTPEFAAISLQALIDSGSKIAAVYTQPDRPANRGQKLQQSPVKTLALAHGIPVEQPLDFKSDESLTTLKEYKPALMVVAAYGIILPQAVLDVPRNGCVNIHASLLPRWRGAAPLQRAIEAGDRESGVTLMDMEAGLDTGPMLAKSRYQLTSTETTATLHDELAKLGAELLLEKLPMLLNGELDGEVQENEQSSYAAKLDKPSAQINWRRSARVLERQIRAYQPWPVAWTVNDEGEGKPADRAIKIFRAEIITEPAMQELKVPAGAEPGTVVGFNGTAIVVLCSDGSLLGLSRLQLPGSRPVSAQDLVNSGKNALKAGVKLTSPTPVAS